jgi:hypothetical protein
VLILIGGCHSLGATSAIKAFSLYNQEHEILEIVKNNAKRVVEKISKDKNIFHRFFNKSITEFYVIMKRRETAHRIDTPTIKESMIIIKE